MPRKTGYLMREVLDHLGRKTQLKERVERIVSLCPSQTETLIHLGVGERLVGITRFCVAPQNIVASISKVGGTKQVDMEKIISLRPDFILAEKEENTKEMVEELEKIAPVYVTDVGDFDSSVRMIRDLGNLLDLVEPAAGLIRKINQEFAAIEKESQAQSSSIVTPRSKRVLYFIWREPYMIAGAGTFIDSMIKRAGFINAGAELGDRYPEISVNEIRNMQANYLFLSSEPFPFGKKHIEEMRQITGEQNSYLVDGENFSWYGARMQEMPEYFRRLHKLVLASGT